MEDDFKKAWEEYFAPIRSTLSEAQVIAYDKFALSNRERAKNFIASIQSHLKYDFKEKRVLDVGSAYAGFVICCAQMGAQAYGVEILEHLHELAIANALNEKGSINLINKNVLDKSVLSETGNQPFDLIIINDVFEHIYDAYALFQRIKDLSHADTLLYFEIPNGDSWQGIEKEGHKYQFGLTLLEPGAWPKELGAFNIYYRSLGHYQIHFHHIGYSHLYLKVDKKALETSRERVIKKFDELEMIINDGPFEGGFHNEHAKNKFNILKQKINDVFIDDPVKFHLIYDQHFWRGYATQKIIPDLEKNNELVSVSLESSRSKQTFRMNALLEKIAHKLSRYKLM